MMSMRARYSKGSAAAAGYSSCELCMHLSPIDYEHCEFCNARIHPRIPSSVQRTLALLITAIVAYFPANIYPIMTTTVLGTTYESTILSGVLHFAETGDYFVALVIFGASVVIPTAKIIALLWLSYNASRKAHRSDEQLVKLYEATEFIGKWSMVDVFVVAISAALAQISGILTINADVATVAFSIVVVSSMLAAFSLDTRLLWDHSIGDEIEQE